MRGWLCNAVQVAIANAWPTAVSAGRGYANQVVIRSRRCAACAGRTNCPVKDTYQSSIVGLVATIIKIDDLTLCQCAYTIQARDRGPATDVTLGVNRREVHLTTASIDAVGEGTDRKRNACVVTAIPGDADVAARRLPS